MEADITSALSFRAINLPGRNKLHWALLVVFIALSENCLNC